MDHTKQRTGNDLRLEIWTMEMTLEHLRKEAVELGEKIVDVGNYKTWLSSKCAKNQFGFKDPSSGTDEVIDMQSNRSFWIPVEYEAWQEDLPDLDNAEMTGNELVEVLDRLIAERDGKWSVAKRLKNVIVSFAKTAAKLYVPNVFSSSRFRIFAGRALLGFTS